MSEQQPDVRLTYHQQLDRLLRRRALMTAGSIGVLLLVALVVFLSSLVMVMRASLVDPIQEDAVVVLHLIANEIPLSLLTEPLDEQQEQLEKVEQSLRQVMTEAEIRNLLLARRASDGSYNAVVEMSHPPGEPLRVYEGVPVELPFQPEQWPDQVWIGDLLSVREEDGSAREYLPVYLVMRDESGQVVGTLGIESPLGEMDAILDQMQAVVVMLALIIILIAVLVGWWVMHRTMQAMRAFLLPVDNILSDDFSFRYPVHGTPLERSLFEIVNLAAERLEEKFKTLERQVEEARQALERRAGYLAATAQVGRVASSIFSVEELLEESAQLIARYFGFYHVGLFLVDESRTWAVLKAASSEGGKRMLARKHRLQLGQGVVGYAAQTGRPRIASDVDVDIVWVPNPDLPETRSEMAVPMSVRGNVIGVLDVQSTEPSAFTAEDVATLRVLAGQLAVAIENARLFRESQVALAEARALQMGEMLRGWQRWRQHLYGYHYDATETRPITTPLEGMSASTTGLELERTTNTITAPLVWGGFVIGYIRITREPSRPWTAEEIRLVEAAVADVSQALENARLLEEIRERARVERAVSNVATHLQPLLEPELILKETIRQLGATLEIDYAMIEVSPEEGAEAAPAEAAGDDEGGVES